MSVRVGIALGSNLGDRLAHLRAARDRLAGIAVPGEPLLEAPVYQTAPVGCPPGSPDFYNTVVEISFAGSPAGLLEITRGIETDLGRRAAAERNAPRVVDLDLLYFGDQVLDSPALTLPHPRLTGRRFVLQPLADIRPDLVLPGATAPVSALLAKLPGAVPVRLGNGSPLSAPTGFPGQAPPDPPGPSTCGR